jgi:hypothetical protein
MRLLRARLPVFALVLLLQQAGALALTGALACCAPKGSREMAQMECCKTGGASHVCPLANRRAPGPGERMSRGCSNEPPGVLMRGGSLYAAPLVERFALLAPVVAPGLWQDAAEEHSPFNAPPLGRPPKS